MEDAVLILLWACPACAQQPGEECDGKVAALGADQRFHAERIAQAKSHADDGKQSVEPTTAEFDAAVTKYPGLF